MKKSISLIAILAFSVLSAKHSFAQNGIITTIAGTGVAGYSGDGGPATAAMISSGSNGVAVDNAGNIYYVDTYHHVIRKINSTGIITTIAGTGVSGYSGDGGQATDAQLFSPGDLAIDNAGNIYISDGNNFRVRKINTAGVISTLAGNGVAGSSGDGGPATAAAVWPARVCTDNAGNVYVVDGVHVVIRKIDAAGIITTFAGNGTHGFSGDGGPATAAQIDGPGGVAADAAGNVYIADGANYRIRKVNTSGIITTFAGNGVAGYSGDGGPALAANISSPYDIYVDDVGNLLLAEGDDNVIRKISVTGIISTVAGNGSPGCSGVENVSALSQPIRQPVAICADHLGRLLILDYYCNRLRMVSNPPDVVADSFSVYYSTFCAGPEFTVSITPVTSGYSIKTYYGDGTNTTSAISGGYAHFMHNYLSSGNYNVKHILYNGTTAIDSVHYNYEYTLCNSFPISFFYDGNNNCVKDSTDEPYVNLPILTAVDSNGIAIDTFSATNGSYYNAYGNPNDVYTFHVISVPAGLQFSCSGTGIVTDTIKPTTYNNPSKNIGFQCISAVSTFDIEEHMTTWTGKHMQSGLIILGNNYCNPKDATVTVTFSDKYAFGSSSILPLSVAGNVVTWSMPALAAYNSHQHNIQYELDVPSTWLLPGDTVHSYVVADPIAGDADGSNNTEIKIDTVRSSYDPNEMIVAPEGIIKSGTQLKYTVNFENTGNDTAHNIYVMDTLSDNVIPTSLRIIAASAEMKTSVLKAGGHNIIRFDFPNINLLDSSHHIGCIGTVMFTINTKSGLPDGTLILNHAGIFFDDNPVVMTNTAMDIIGIPTSADNLNRNTNISLYPNPVTDQLTIKTANTGYDTYLITNAVGQTTMQGQLTGARTTLITAALPAGVYYITFKGDNGVKVQKFVKQ